MKILVSVSSLGEVTAVIEGGAEILDVKNPNEGSLGAAFPWLISEIKSLAPTHAISVAIGDMPHLPGTAALAATGAAVLGVDYVKVGLRGARSKKEAIQLLRAVVRAVKDRNPRVNVVGACYADGPNYGLFDPLDMPEVARLSKADVAMIDTLSKNGQNLFDFLDLADLKVFNDESHSNGVLTALAGSLRVKHLQRLYEIGTDIVGFRGAVCSHNDRKRGTVTLGRVTKLVNYQKNLETRMELVTSK
ncbi:MAG: (5-formylfuran-3-yl)methyl phosphate synthase [Promethearchaeota archaeon]